MSECFCVETLVAYEFTSSNCCIRVLCVCVWVCQPKNLTLLWSLAIANIYMCIDIFFVCMCVYWIAAIFISSNSAQIFLSSSSFRCPSLSRTSFFRHFFAWPFSLLRLPSKIIVSIVLLLVLDFSLLANGCAAATAKLLECASLTIFLLLAAWVLFQSENVLWISFKHHFHFSFSKNLFIPFAIHRRAPHHVSVWTVRYFCLSSQEVF